MPNGCYNLWVQWVLGICGHHIGYLCTFGKYLLGGLGPITSCKVHTVSKYIEQKLWLSAPRVVQSWRPNCCVLRKDLHLGDLLLRGLPLPPASSCTDLRLHVRLHLLLGLPVFFGFGLPFLAFRIAI